MIIMKKTKKPYERPEVDVFTVGLQKCIALSGFNESYSSDAGGYNDNENEDLVVDNGAW